MDKMMNNKGQVIVYGFMIGIVIIILAVAVATPIKVISDRVQNQTSEIGGLDCSNVSISDFDKINCLAVDLTMPYFIGILLAIGGIVLTARILIQ